MKKTKLFACVTAALTLFALAAFAEETADETAPAETETATAASGTEAYLAERDAEMEKWLRAYDPSLTDEQVAETIAARAIDPEKPMVAMTFDDGPVAGITDKVLDILEANNCRATFFIVGARLKKEENAVLLNRMLALGCEIGNHTYNHENLKNLGTKSALKEVSRVNDAVEEQTGGYKVKSLRPPGGATNNHVIQIAETEGMCVITWSQSCNVNELDPEQIAKNVYEQPKNHRLLQAGDIVLLHDTKDRMVTAMEILIPKMVADGWQLVTVQELLNLTCEAGYTAGLQYKSASDYHGLQKVK